MTWDTSVLRRDAKPIICLEIVLDETTLYYADADLLEDDKFWEGRIMSVSSLSRSVDPLNAGFNVNDVTVTLNNNEPGDAYSAGHFGPLLGTYGFKNRTANVYLKFVEDDGTIVSKQVLSGLCTPQQLTAGEFTLGIRPAILEKLGILQRTIDIVAFPNAPFGSGSTKPTISTLGKGHNIILGNMTSSVGAVELVMVDKTTNAEKFAVAQHAITSVNAVYQLRADTLATLVLTTDYTVNKNASDGYSKPYSYIQLTAGKWQEGDRYFASVQGIDANGDGSGALITNPVDSFKQMILDNSPGLVSGDLDSTSWSAASTECGSSGRSYNTSGYFGACIPLSPGEVESPGDQWNLLQEICRGFNHALIITTEGKIGIKSIDASTESSSSSLVRYVERNGDFTTDGLDINLEPFGNLVNSVRYLFKQAHNSDSGFESYVQGDDTGSQSYYSLIKSAVWNNRCARDLEMAKDVLGRELSLIAGKASTIQWTVPGLWGMQSGSDLGDFVELYHKRGLEDWTNNPKQIIVTDLKANLQEGTVNVGGVTAGEGLGPMQFTAQESTTLTAVKDTFIGATQNPCSGTNFFDANAGSGYGTLSYLRHGHHNGLQTLCTDMDPGYKLGYGDINWRSLLRWKLPYATWQDRTIISVVIQLYVLEVPSLQYDGYYDVYYYRSGWTGGAIHKCTNDIWTDSSSANGLGGLSGHIGTSLGSISGGTGSKSIELNATGIEMFQKCCDTPATGQGTSNDEVNLCLHDLSGGSYTNACKIASIEHSTVAYRPKAIIVYTATS